MLEHRLREGLRELTPGPGGGAQMGVDVPESRQQPGAAEVQRALGPRRCPLSDLADHGTVQQHPRVAPGLGPGRVDDLAAREKQVHHHPSICSGR